MHKHDLRLQFTKIRHQLPIQRRLEAVTFIYKEILQFAEHHHWVMSYASFGDELDTTQLNDSLAQMGKLILPKVNEKHKLTIFHVEHTQTQLVRSKWGILEPNPTLCKKIPTTELTLILVPGLAFDANHHRLGYGKGIYDRFLSTLPKIVHRLGIGFKEQQLSSPLHSLDHDIAVDDLLLG